MNLGCSFACLVVLLSVAGCAQSQHRANASDGDLGSAFRGERRYWPESDFEAGSSEQPRHSAPGAVEDVNQTRDEFENRMAEWLVEVDEQIKELKRRIVSQGDEVVARWQPQLDELEDLRQVATQRLEDMSQSTSNGWKLLREAVLNSCDELRETVTRMRDEFDAEQREFDSTVGARHHALPMTRLDPSRPIWG